MFVTSLFMNKDPLIFVTIVPTGNVPLTLRTRLKCVICKKGSLQQDSSCSIKHVESKQHILVGTVSLSPSIHPSSPSSIPTPPTHSSIYPSCSVHPSLPSISLLPVLYHSIHPSLPPSHPSSIIFLPSSLLHPSLIPSLSVFLLRCLEHIPSIGVFHLQCKSSHVSHLSASTLRSVPAWIFFCRILHTIFSHLRAHAFARSVIVVRSSAVQASAVGEEVSHRLWLPAVAIHRLGVIEIAPSPHHCFRTAHHCTQSVESLPTKPESSPDPAGKDSATSSPILTEAGTSVRLSFQSRSLLLLAEKSSGVTVHMKLFRDCNLLAAGW